MSSALPVSGASARRSLAARGRDLPLTAKIFAAVAAVATAGLLVIGVSISGLTTADEEASAIYTGGVRPVEALAEVHTDLLQMRNLVLNYYLSDAEHRRTNAADMDALDAEIAQDAPVLAAMVADKAAWERIYTDWRAYTALRDGKIMPAADAGDLDAFWEGFNAAQALNERIDEGFEDLRAAQSNAAAASAATAHDTVGQVVTQVGVIGGA
ncbi:MCP four helix bundle domain-containing protein, partial [Planobispora siamensis]